MVKKLDADSAATQVNQALQPTVDFRVVQPTDPRQVAPANKPPASPEVRRALGINQPWRTLP